MEATDFHQKIEKRKNQDKILKLIDMEGKSYTQLESELDFSHTTLAKHIKELRKTREIRPAIQNDQIVYKLGDKGIINPSDISHVSSYLKNIKKRGGEAHYDYSHLQGEILSSSLPWSITSHLIIDKDVKKIKLLTIDDVRDIEKLVYQKMIQNIKNEKLQGNVLQGHFQLGFNVDYKELLESFKAKSLDYFEMMSKEEGDLLSKIDDDPESVTDKEIKRLQKLREKTYEKIRNKNKNQ